MFGFCVFLHGCIPDRFSDPFAGSLFSHAGLVAASRCAPCIMSDQCFNSGQLSDRRVAAIVDLLRHSDPEYSFLDWNLTSYVGQAVASGIYLFSVEDRRTGGVQVGKFVIIR
jgi:hypothetical protein